MSLDFWHFPFLHVYSCIYCENLCFFFNRYQRNYNKKSGRWSVCPVKVQKEYHHVSNLMKRVLKMRLEDDTGMCRPVVLSADDPRRISATLAPVPPPPTADIVKEQKSRFRQFDPDATEDYDL